MFTRRLILVSLAFARIVAVTTAAVATGAAVGPRWSAEERAMLASLSLASLQPLADDHTNRYANDSLAAALGRDLFFD